MTGPAEPLRIGDPTHLGAYTLRGRLGSGGMGMVYLASDPSGEPVAVKVIRPDVADQPLFRDRFRREVTAARRVPRFCTAAVRDADPNGNPPYLVTDYVPGPTLTNAVRTTPLKGAELEQVAVNIATALAVIHGAGVVHRDLKPSNVLLSPTGARVIDFGIATAHDMTILTAEQTIGTPDYMAPEAFDGAPPSPAMDIFAWGGVVLFAATRTPPFLAEPPALLPHRIRHEHPAHLHRLPEPLRGAVTAAMAKQPGHRPTAEQLYRLLTGPAPTTQPRPLTSPDDTRRWVPDITRPQNPAVLTARPPAPPSPHAPPATPPPRRRRTLIAAAVAAAVAVLAAAALTLTADHHAGPGTLTAAQRTTAARTLATAAQNTTNPALAERLAVAAWHLNPTASTNILLSATTGRLPPLSIAGHAGPITTIAVTADGRTLATSSKDQTARLWDLTTPDTHPTILATLPHTAAVTAISLNPTGTLAATTSDDNTLHLWNIRNRADPTPAGTYTLQDAGHPIAAVFTPTGTTLALTTSTGDLFTLDLTDPTHLTTLATIHAHTDAATAQPIPNTTTLATASTDGTVRLWDLTNPHTPQPLTRITPTSTPVNLAISPDGHTLATAGADGTISLWNIHHPTTPEPLTTLNPPNPTPDTRHSSTLTDLTGLTDAATAVAFNPAGTLLAATDTTGTLHLWTVTDPHNPQPLATLTAHTAIIRDVMFTPDGTRILTAGDDSTVRLWDLNPTSLYRRACTTTNNQLTPAEWTRYLPHTPYQPPCPTATSLPPEAHSAPS